MTTIYLIRHAEAEGNTYRRFHGWYNSLITPDGYRQIALLERRFADVPVEAVYSSDLFRTMATAGAVYKPRGLELHTDPGLREFGGGVWEDKTWGELVRFHGPSLDAFFRGERGWQVEGSETFPAVERRVTSAIRRIAAAHDGQTAAIFSHGLAIRLALAHFLGKELGEIPLGDNTSVTKLRFDGDRVEVDYAGDNSHLEGLSSLSTQQRKKDGTDFGDWQLWFRPLDFSTEADFFRQARREAWQTIHHTMKGFQGEGFLADAKETARRDPNCVLVAMRKNERAGVLQLDPLRDAEQGVGRIPFFYMAPEHRAHGLGVQLLGQAVSTFRPMDRQFLRLRCAPENLRARRFYERYGFTKVGTEPGGLGTLDVLEKFIGYQLN